MIHLILLLSLVSSVSSQTVGSLLCYPFVQQDCPLGQICEQGICQQRDMCYTDRDCPNYPSERCENGRCVPEADACRGFCRIYLGSICEFGRCVWRPGAPCNGIDNLPCSSGHVCRNGICRRDSTECESDFECPDPHRPRCVNGKCEITNGTCLLQGFCRMYPKSICQNGRCVWPPGARCDGLDYLPCSSGHVCRNGFCERDRECIYDSDCLDPYRPQCVNGKCKRITDESCPGNCMYFEGTYCQNGQCVLPPGARCNGRGFPSCSSGYVCRNGFCRRRRVSLPCRSDFECPATHLCRQRRCREQCGFTGICPAGYICDFDVCVPTLDGPIPTSSPTPTAPSGTGCRNNAECPPGQECIRIGSQRQCVFVIS